MGRPQRRVLRSVNHRGKAPGDVAGDPVPGVGLDVRDVRQDYGDNATPLWITEAGVTTTPNSSTFYLSENDQAVYLKKLYTEDLSATPENELQRTIDQFHKTKMDEIVAGLRKLQQ